MVFISLLGLRFARHYSDVFSNPSPSTLPREVSQRNKYRTLAFIVKRQNRRQNDYGIFAA